MAELLCPPWLPPTANRDPWTAMAVEFFRGVSGSVRHCAGGLSVSVRAERDTLSTLVPSEPPSRYNVPSVMAADIRQQLTGSPVAESH